MSSSCSSNHRRNPDTEAIYQHRIEELLKAVYDGHDGNSPQYSFGDSTLFAASMLRHDYKSMEAFTMLLLEDEYQQSKLPLNPNNIKHLTSFDHSLSQKIKGNLQEAFMKQCNEIVESILARSLIDAVLAASS